MLAGGFTTVAEFHYLHQLPDGAAGNEMARAVAEGAHRAGIRLVLLPVFYQSGGFGQPSSGRQARFVHRSVADYLALLETLSDLATGIAPHSVRAVMPSVIAELEAGARGLLGDEFPRHIHVSEQRREVTECLEHFGVTPIQLLDENLPLTSQWNLVHATHATEKEIGLMATRGATAILCPLTEAYLGDGVCDVVGLLAAGGRIAVGSDSNVRIDAIEELRMLEYGQRLKQERRACLATADGLGRPLWNAAGSGGAAATGLPVGVLRPGAFADLVVLNEQSPVLGGLEGDMALDALLTGGSAADIDAVYVGGEAVVRSGLHRNEDRVAADYVTTTARLRNRL
jgi:formimidoylglutamate deiminase